MNPRHLWMALFCTLVPAAGLALPEDPVEPKLCSYICGDSGCNTPCRSGGVWITCGQYYGAPANDLDSDGVANTSDNCVCTANANQANCDGDTQGDACDSQNQKWVLIQNLGWCDTKYVTRFGWWDVEIYGEKYYQEVCSGATCFDKYKIDTTSCPLGPSSCNTSASNCCECKWGEPLCGATPGCRNTCPF